VDHERCVDIFERSCLDEFDLATAAFLDWRSYKTHAPGYLGLVQSFYDAEERGDGGSGDQIMTTCVSHVWEGVVIGAVGHDSATGSVFSLERGLETKGVGSCFDVLGFEEGCDGVMGFEFFVSKLGVLVDLSDVRNVSGRWS
jgi:hypothetical protein